MKTKIFVAVISMLIAVTATSVAQQTKEKKNYQKSDFRNAQGERSANPGVISRGAPGKSATRTAKGSVQHRAVRLQAPPRPQVILPPPPQHPVVYNKKFY